MLNDLTTLGAGLKFALPACEAVIVHEPAPVRWTVLPLIVQLPVGVNVTVKPDEAVAVPGSADHGCSTRDWLVQAKRTQTCDRRLSIWTTPDRWDGTA